MNYVLFAEMDAVRFQGKHVHLLMHYCIIMFLVRMKIVSSSLWRKNTVDEDQSISHLTGFEDNFLSVYMWGRFSLNISVWRS